MPAPSSCPPPFARVRLLPALPQTPRETDTSPLADAVQTIYLNALRDYKPKPESLADSEGQVKKWVPPAAPAIPESADASIANQLGAYESQVVEVEGQEASADGEVVAAKVEDWFDEEATFGGEEAKH